VRVHDLSGPNCGAASTSTPDLVLAALRLLPLLYNGVCHSGLMDDETQAQVQDVWTEVWESALPSDTDGAWIREAIARARAEEAVADRLRRTDL